MGTGIGFPEHAQDAQLYVKYANRNGPVIKVDSRLGQAPVVNDEFVPAETQGSQANASEQTINNARKLSARAEAALAHLRLVRERFEQRGAPSEKERRLYLNELGRNPMLAGESPLSAGFPFDGPKDIQAAFTSIVDAYLTRAAAEQMLNHPDLTAVVPLESFVRGMELHLMAAKGAADRVLSRAG